LTLSAQRLTTRLGYAVPRLMVAAGMEKAYHHAMQAAHQAFLQMEEWNPEAAAYVVPNGFNRRVLLTMNLRSADHFITLRSAPNAHFSVRRVAQRMAEMLRGQLPVLGGYLHPAEGETWQQIEADYFTQTA
jgi:thymidylate synthase ThyX